MTDKTGNRRQSSRVQAVFRVSYSSLDSLVSAYTQNISKGGIYIKTKSLLPLNAMVRIKLVMPNNGPEIQCIGQVARVHNQQETPHIPTGMAIVFRDMSEKHMEQIEECIARLSVKEHEDTFAPQPIEKLSVVVVDDDKMLRDRAAQIIRDHGHDVDTAPDGLKGLAMCLKNPPDIIVTDVQMPKMDGWNFLKTIRARPSLASTLVIFQTSLNSEKDRLLGYQLGVDDYLAKPYSAEELMARIERLISRTASYSKSRKDKALRGDLEQVSLPTILSLLELERKTGVVVIVGSTVCRFFIHEGRPLAIEMEGATSSMTQMDMAVKIFSWKTGQFEFAPQDVPTADKLRMSMQSLMMEAARLADEATR